MKNGSVLSSFCSMCGGGGTGRRKGLKIKIIHVARFSKSLEGKGKRLRHASPYNTN